MSAPDSNSVRETPGHSVTSAPDWDRVAEAVGEGQYDVLYKAEVLASAEPWPTILDAARWALQHGPAIEAAPVIEFCQNHNAVAVDGECWVWLETSAVTPCRIVERRLLPGEGE